MHTHVNMYERIHIYIYIYIIVPRRTVARHSSAVRGSVRVKSPPYCCFVVSVVVVVLALWWVGGCGW